MNPDSSLQRLRDALGPTEEQRVRMLATMKANMTSARDIRSVKSLLEPAEGAQIRVWNRIREQISPVRARGFLEQVRSYLTPDEVNVIRLGHGFLPKLQPVLVPARPFKWVAAFAIVIVVLRVSPFLFLAPQTIAQSSVLLRPTKGMVTIAAEGLSQPVETETELLQSATLNTDAGEATIILHDDGTVRMADHTSITLQDLTDRPEKGSGLATLILNEGTVWVQGLVPDHLRGLSVVTPKGVVTVHGGSISVTVQNGGDVVVETWDRHARLERESQGDIVLVAGERLTAKNGEELAITKLADSAFGQEWPTQNLQRDAVHQRAIAQEQRERIAARAGILPTSRLYSVKRIAEEVDVLLTFDHESAVKKRVAQATTRLNEATTLIAEGESGATVQLEEYQLAMLDIAGGSGDTVSQQLVEDSVAENAAQLGAQLPDDNVYVVKRLVLDTSAKLPSQPIDETDVQVAMVSDAVDALQIAAAEGDEEAVQHGLENLAPYIQDLPGDQNIGADAKKEVLSRLTRVADSLQDDASAANGSGAIAMRTVSRVIRTYVPQEPASTPHLSAAEVYDMVQNILDRVFTYSQYTGQTNQLHQELIKLKGHPDEGMILRALYAEFGQYEELNSQGTDVSDFRLSVLVRAAIRGLNEEHGADID